jgi:ribosomal protein L22
MAEDDKNVEETEVEATEAPATEAEAQTEAVVEDAPVEETAAPDEPVAAEEPEAEVPSATEDKPKRAPRRKAADKADEPVADAKPARRERAAAGDAPVVRAQAKYVRTSARKARLVCDNIRGKSVEEARAILAFTPRAVAKDWAKLLNSAVANAEHNHELLGDDLKVATAYADEGPTLKRFQPRAMGRATKIRKRTSHLTITLTPKE